MYAETPNYRKCWWFQKLVITFQVQNWEKKDEISVDFENHEIRMEIQYLNYIATSFNAFHIVWKVFTNHDIF